jgi:virulence-associated protein VagC
LPVEFHLEGSEGHIKKVGKAIIQINKENPWQSLTERLDQYSDDFIKTREQRPLTIGRPYANEIANSQQSHETAPVPQRPKDAQTVGHHQALT